MNSLRLTWLLVALNLVVIFVLLSVFVEKSEPGRGVEAVAGKVVQDLPTVPEITFNIIGDVSEITERPLFNEDRQPDEVIEPEIPTAKAPASDASEFKLVGIVLRPDISLALLQRKNREVEQVIKGGQIDGWELTSVEDETVVLVKAGKKVQLELERTSLPVKSKKTRFNSRLKRPKK